MKFKVGETIADSYLPPVRITGITMENYFVQELNTISSEAYSKNYIEEQYTLTEGSIISRILNKYEGEDN